MLIFVHVFQWKDLEGEMVFKVNSWSNFRISIFSFWKEGPGIVGPKSCWCCGYDCYLHIHESFLGLLWEVLTEFKRDRHLVG